MLEIYFLLHVQIYAYTVLIKRDDQTPDSYSYSYSYRLHVLYINTEQLSGLVLIKISFIYSKVIF